VTCIVYVWKTCPLSHLFVHCCKSYFVYVYYQCIVHDQCAVFKFVEFCCIIVLVGKLEFKIYLNYV
jgi:hypothetical protein